MSRHHSHAARSPSHWLQWIAVIALLLLAFGHFVVKPLAESAFRGAMAFVGSVAQGLGVIARMPFDAATASIERSPHVAAMLGEPLVCAPFEQTRWIDTQGRDELEFTFDVSGPNGSGEAHVVAVVTDQGLEPARVIVSGPTGAVLLTPPW